MFLHFQAIQFFLVPHPVQDTTGIEKDHPDTKRNQCDRVFIEQK